MTDRFSLGIELNGPGAHPAAWRAGGEAEGSATAAPRIIDLVQRTERAGFTLATFAESAPAHAYPHSIAQLDPIEITAFAAAFTDSLGLVPVAGTIYTEPFHLANQLASTDFASLGRAGWIADASDSIARSRSYGAGQVTEPGARRREAAEVISAVRLLWDTWEDGVFVADTERQQFLDPNRLHYADFEGEFFSIKGPSITPRPPQGQLVVFVNYDSAEEDGLPPELADVLLISGPTAQAISAQARSARAEGSGDQLVFAEIEVALDTDTATAADRIADLDQHTAWVDTGRLRHVGSPAALVALIGELADQCDGVRLHPAVIEVDLAVLERSVLPELRERTTFTPPGKNATLRSSLGLQRPQSIFAHGARTKE